VEYIYAALMLHSVGKGIDEGSVTGVLRATGADVDSVRVKALVSALEDIDIEDAISKAAFSPSVSGAKVEKKEEEGKGRGEEGRRREGREGGKRHRRSWSIIWLI
jgi:Ribosomal protein L12E/L44/L45/RPP1/RPP2